MLTDKMQTNDLSGDAENSAILAELKQAYEDWPKEIEDESTLTTAASGVVFDGKSVPKANKIASGRIKIWNGDDVYVDQRKDAEEGADGIPFTVKDLHAGPAFVQTWFYNAAGEMEGAVYYNYARPDVVAKNSSR